MPNGCAGRKVRHEIGLGEGRLSAQHRTHVHESLADACSVGHVKAEETGVISRSRELVCFLSFIIHHYELLFSLHYFFIFL